MPYQLKELTSAKWKALKKDAKIKSAGFLKRDASVGKHITAYQTARKAWHDRQDWESIVAYISKLSDLHEAFTEFVGAKEFKTELAKELQQDIQGWTNFIEGKLQKLRKEARDNEQALKTAMTDDLYQVFEELGV